MMLVSIKIIICFGTVFQD